MKHYNLCWLSIAATILTAAGCVVAEGPAYCGSQTVQLNTLQHCESCAPCADGLICQNNHCLSGQCSMICNGVVIDSRFDSANCGSCGNVCAAGFECVSSSCKRITDLSTATITCNAQTVTPYNDRLNCAGCGIACASRYACDAGNCVESTNVGDIITFGHYEQDSNTSNGKEPIEWRVLDIDSDGHVLIISDKVLDRQLYNTTDISIIWEKSTIRSWLNGYASSYNTVGTSYTINNFIDTAFTAEEKARIIASNVPAQPNPHSSSTPAGNPTTDKIFLLSVVEAESYFTTNEACKAYATPYAINNGVYAYNYDTSKQCTVSNYIMNKCQAFWWLRSPCDDSYGAALVSIHSGGIGGSYVSNVDIGVRPALWLN